MPCLPWASQGPLVALRSRPSVSPRLLACPGPPGPIPRRAGSHRDRGRGRRRRARPPPRGALRGVAERRACVRGVCAWTGRRGGSGGRPGPPTRAHLGGRGRKGSREWGLGRGRSAPCPLRGEWTQRGTDAVSGRSLVCSPSRPSSAREAPARPVSARVARAGPLGRPGAGTLRAAARRGRRSGPAPGALSHPRGPAPAHCPLGRARRREGRGSMRGAPLLPRPGPTGPVPARAGAGLLPLSRTGAIERPPAPGRRGGRGGQLGRTGREGGPPSAWGLSVLEAQPLTTP